VPTEVVAEAIAAADAVEVPLEVAAPVKPVLPDGMAAVRAPVVHSLARTFQNAAPADQADVVAAVYARLFFWKLNLRRDLQAGDEVAVAWEWDGELADIPVASYHSKKLGATLNAYKFKAAGDRYPSWWDEEGNEVAYRLKDSPLDEYEQVTSLLKDRPRHRGMDFKVPEGTAVLSPRSGTVARVNWNLANNGNCVEIKFRDGTIAKFLHLAETTVRPGQAIGARAKLGLSGNTGHSTAPHLHYELAKNGVVVDPVDYHGTIQRTLPASDQTQFAETVEQFDLLLHSAT
jgi:murein DD-endopeptidase MepM/ murein hydrolase activator NlpD